MENKVIGYPFVSHVDQNARPEIDAKDFISKVFSGGYHSSLSNVMATGCDKSMGYRFNLTPYLKLFLYKQHGSWNEAFAPNKTALRKSLYGRVDRIVEIDKN
jgi:hypothetical protein